MRKDWAVLGFMLLLELRLRKPGIAGYKHCMSLEQMLQAAGMSTLTKHLPQQLFGLICAEATNRIPLTEILSMLSIASWALHCLLISRAVRCTQISWIAPAQHYLLCRPTSWVSA